MSVRSLTPALAALALTFAAASASAQPAAQPAAQSGGAMQGFQMNRDQPVRIESNSLEVRDKQRQATFIGKVKLTQGETILQCDTLVIFYEDTSATPAPAKKGAPAAPVAQKGGGGPSSQQIKRAEAKGNVLVTQKDQTAKGDNGVFDVKSNNIVLTGNVAVTQGQNVLRGTRMVVDLNTGVSRVDGRVEGLFTPSAPTQTPSAPAPAPQKDAKPAPAPPPKSAPGAPTRIN